MYFISALMQAGITGKFLSSIFQYFEKNIIIITMAITMIQIIMIITSSILLIIETKIYFQTKYVNVTKVIEYNLRVFRVSKRIIATLYFIAAHKIGIAKTI